MLQHKFSPFIVCLDLRLHGSYFTFFCFCEYQNDSGRLCSKRSSAAVWIIVLFVCPPACCRRSLPRWLKRRLKKPGIKRDDIIVLYSSVMHFHMCMHIDVWKKRPWNKKPKISKKKGKNMKLFVCEPKPKTNPLGNILKYLFIQSLGSFRN